jgi:lipopolysaccharide/colanic/teichoic acid biosynthesis glycosyltransferase
MSIVGPRPVVPELTVEFRLEHERLLVVRYGLADPATVKYRREAEVLAQVPEPLRYFKAVVTPDKLRISQEYLQRASVWSDFGLMAATVWALYPANWRPRVRRFQSAGVNKAVRAAKEDNSGYQEIVSNRLA